MTAAILTGCGVGAGLALLIAALWPAQRSLGAALAVLRAPVSSTLLPEASPASWQARLGQAVMQATRRLGMDYHRLRADLALLDRPLHSHIARKTLWAVGAGLAGPLLAGLLDVGGVHVPLFAQAWLAVGLAILGFVLPDRRVRAAARRRRAHLRYTVGALLNLVAINLAGGAEVEEAVHVLESAAGGEQRHLLGARIRDGLQRAPHAPVWGAGSNPQRVEPGERPLCGRLDAGGGDPGGLSMPPSTPGGVGDGSVGGAVGLVVLLVIADHTDPDRVHWSSLCRGAVAANPRALTAASQPNCHRRRPVGVVVARRHHCARTAARRPTTPLTGRRSSRHSHMTTIGCVP